MSIDQQIDELLLQVDNLMQELIKNKAPCAELIEKTIIRLSVLEYYNFITDASVVVFVGPVQHWVRLRKQDIPTAIDGCNGRLSPIIIEIDHQYWWSAPYAKQLIIVHCLPKLLEKVLEQTRKECVIAPTAIVFDTAKAPKRSRWQFWGKEQ